MRFDSLLPIYADLATVVQRAGRTYPAAVELQDSAPEGLVELSTDPVWIDPELRAAGESHLQAVAKRSPRMHDGRVLSCIDANGLPVMCTPAGYFDAIATSDSLRAEYVRSPLATEASDAGVSALPLRALAHRASGGNVLRSGRGRVGAIGVSVAVTLPSPQGRALVIGRRNDQVATDPGLWHVAPSGTLEPTHGDPVIELVDHELHEELGIRLPASAELASRLKPLGVGYDLLRLQPEICLRLDLDTHEYPPDGPLLTPSEFQERCLVELSSGAMNAFWESHPPELLTPAASATIALLELADNARLK